MQIVLVQDKGVYHKLDCLTFCSDGQGVAEIMDIPPTYNIREAPVIRDGRDYNPCPECCQRDKNKTRRRA